jgi:FMN reductase
MARTPFIVGIGGTVDPGSSTETALILALAAAAELGARTTLFDGEFLTRLPHYGTAGATASPDASAFLDAIREADGIVLASPGYHGSISGLVKNAIDYMEATASDQRVYFEGLPVGLIATAYGWQATGSTLNALRSIVHALRGWPTPLGAGINSAGGIFKGGKCSDPAVLAQLQLVGRQVVEFARLRQPARHVED